ncbi:MAG: 4Fe-4S binding protein [Oscillospiraceae bacterium]|nr:4Fe-4S binding protein [Oscillospiraceae bacterium]
MGRRRYVQLLSALLYNANLAGFVRGTIYTGSLKGLCVPGLNCHSCPGAIAACPLGSFQTALGDIRTKLPLYIVGVLVLFGVLLGRAICAFLCPFGLAQDLLHKIPSPKLRKSTVTRWLSLCKYIVLFIFVVYLPLHFLRVNGVSTPAFCKYLCPMGTLQAGIPLVLANESLRAIVGALFQWRLVWLGIILLTSIFLFRPFCRFLCPLGAIYSLFNKYALFGIKVNAHRCTGCRACVNSCKLDVHQINDRECIRCGDCLPLCPHKAIVYKRKDTKNEE